jgi:hypothetical protein
MGGTACSDRQGYILLVATEALPHDAAPVPPVRCNGRLRHVLAMGEATGRAHTLLADDRVGSIVPLNQIMG